MYRVKLRRMSLLHIRLRQWSGFMRFYRKAQTLYDVHSPYVARFIGEVLEDDRQYYAFPTIEGYRKQLLENHTSLSIRDLGAGSQVSDTTSRTISDLARHTPVSPRVGRLLFRLVNFQKPKHLLELGTSLGISGMYQSAAAPSKPMWTIEGNPASAEFAQRQFRRIGLLNTQVYNAPFEEALPALLEQMDGLDYAFVDGNHRYEPTERYVNWMLEKVHPGTIIVLADIYWSKEMRAVWDKLRYRPEVRASIDLYDVGLLLFRSEFAEQQHWTLVPRVWKPWHLGLRAPR